MSSDSPTEPPEFVPDSPTGNHYYVYSTKPPEEAFLFGLRGADIEQVIGPTRQETLVSPEEYGITGPRADGLCKYCQLMLHPSPPAAAHHQPNLPHLLKSTETCEVCQWLNVALAKGSPTLLQRYQSGDPSLCDPNNYSKEVSVSIHVKANNTTIVPFVGIRQGMGVQSGMPLSATTVSRLGSTLASRRFWESDPGRPNNDGSRLELLKDWLSECGTGHAHCSSPSEGRILPTRVLDLTGSSDIPSKVEDVKIRLRETAEGEVGDYVTLSYRWGDEPLEQLRTTEATLESHKAGMDLGVFPLTHREAILATLYIGKRYLWIDSLCIIQDSPRDWQTEAASLCSVYSNSFLTLAATAGPNPQYGLLNPLQSPLRVSPVRVEEKEGKKEQKEKEEEKEKEQDVVMVRFETNTTIDAPSEPLNTRGWTLQERFLSPRLVCFGSEQWLWRCASRQTTEDGLIDESDVDGKGITTANSGQWAVISQRAPDENPNYYFFQQWHRLVEDYSRRQLTFRSDKLKAIAGLADAFARRTGCQFAAGLWLEDMPAGLIWTVTRKGVVRHNDNTDQEADEEGAIPSWSWASVTGPIMPPPFRIPLLGQRSEVIHLQVEHLEQEWEGVPLSSPLHVARLHVRGKMIQAHLGQRSSNLRLRYRLTPTPDPDEVLGEAMLDNAELAEKGLLTTVYCLLVLSPSSSSGSGDPDERFVLLLTRSSGSESDDVYKRLGIGVLPMQTKFVDRRRDEGRDMFANVSEESLVLE